MPGQICAIASCKSNRLTLKKKGIKLIFHTFPKSNDLDSSTIKKEWINRCRRADKFNPDTSAICSLHFTPNDYERDLQNELLGLPVRRVLKKTAVPTLNLRVRNKKLGVKSIEGTSRVKGTEKTAKFEPKLAKRAEKKRTKEKPVEGIPQAKRTEKKIKLKPVEDNHPAERAEKKRDKNKPVEDNHRGEKREENGVESLVETNLIDLELSKFLDITSTSTNSISSNIEIIYQPDSYKQKYEQLLLKYNELKANTTNEIKELNKMLNYYKAKCYNQQT